MEPSNSTSSNNRPPRKAARRTFTATQRAGYFAEIQGLVARGMLIDEACAKVGIGRSQYNNWRKHPQMMGKNGKHYDKALAKHLPSVRRPPADQIEVLEVPAPRNGHRHTELSRIERIAALIVAVEKLL